VSRPEIDVTSLVVGAVLSAVAVTHLVGEARDADVDLAWIAASSLVALGAVAVVLGLLRTARRRKDTSAGTNTDASTDASTDVYGTNVEAGTNVGEEP